MPSSLTCTVRTSQFATRWSNNWNNFKSLQLVQVYMMRWCIYQNVQYYFRTWYLFWISSQFTTVKYSLHMCSKTMGLRENSTSAFTLAELSITLSALSSRSVRLRSVALNTCVVKRSVTLIIWGAFYYTAAINGAPVYLLIRDIHHSKIPVLICPRCSL